MGNSETRFIFVTGGVVSSLGKGITSASLGALLPIFFPPPMLSSDLSYLFRCHILVAMLAYSSFALAVAHGSIMIVQPEVNYHTNNYC